MALRQYNAAEVSVIVGTRPLKGLAADTFVSVEREEQSFVKSVGADGEVTRSKTNNKTGAITITLQQSSPDNAYLSSLQIADENTASGVVPVMIRDASGNTLHFSEQSWIRQPATSEFGRDSGTREWVFDCASIEMNEGGN